MTIPIDKMKFLDDYTTIRNEYSEYPDVNSTGELLDSMFSLRAGYILFGDDTEVDNFLKLWKISLD